MTTRLRITTPYGIFYDDDIEIVTVKTTEGYIGLQYNHVPFISTIVISTLYIKNNSSQQKVAAIGGGIIFVEKEYIDIFTDDISWKEDLNEKIIEQDINLVKTKIDQEKSQEISRKKNELKLKKLLNQLETIRK